MNKIFYRCVWMFAISLFVLLNSCNTSSSSGFNEETTTRGKIKIGVDESFQLIMDTEIYTFQSLYSHAHITPIYKPELVILDNFLKDSVRLMVTSRLLTKDEEEYLKSKHFVARTTKIAYDALVFIVNKNRVDTLIKYPIIKDIFSGKVNNWKQINPKVTSSEIKVIFDNQKSGNVRYFMEKFKLTNQLPKNCLAVDSNNQVIDYVQKHEDALGVISVNWISDKHDSISHIFLNKINVVAVSSEFDTEGVEFTKPYQAYIADKSYPFIREVYMISRETFTGLGSGFISFVASDPGQRIILKSKLVPATMPVRLVEAKK